MRPYWVNIEEKAGPTFFNLGVGITARSDADARDLFESAFGSEHRIISILPIEDMRQIEQNHVAPNMGNWFQRGIWFPLGYDHIAENGNR